MTTLTPFKKIIPSVISSSCSHISIGLLHVYVRIHSFTPKVQTDELLLGSNPKTPKIKKVVTRLQQESGQDSLRLKWERSWGREGGEFSVYDAIVQKI